MIDLFGALGKLLRGKVKFRLDEGVIEYEGQRVFVIPASAAGNIMRELEKYLGDAAPIIMERLGAALGESTRAIMGWKTGEDALRELPDVAKLGGVGKATVKEGRIVMENLPIEINEALLRYIAGFLEGLCIHVEEIGGGGHRAEAKVAPRPCP